MFQYNLVTDFRLRAFRVAPEAIGHVVVAEPPVASRPRIAAQPPPLARVRQMYREVAIGLDVYLSTGQLPEPPAPVFDLDPNWLVPEPYDRVGNPRVLELMSIPRWLVDRLRRINQVEVTGPAVVQPGPDSEPLVDVDVQYNQPQDELVDGLYAWFKMEGGPIVQQNEGLVAAAELEIEAAERDRRNVTALQRQFIRDVVKNYVGGPQVPPPVPGGFHYEWQQPSLPVSWVAWIRRVCSITFGEYPEGNPMGLRMQKVLVQYLRDDERDNDILSGFRLDFGEGVQQQQQEAMWQ